MSAYYASLQTARLYNSLVAQAERLAGEIYELRRAIWNERLRMQQKLDRINRLRRIMASTPQGSVALQQLEEYRALEEEYRREEAMVRQMEERHRQLEQQLIRIMDRIKSMRVLMGGGITVA
jgi:histidinol-phosphate/aromatic aminotransferase/cobyric acid decarboxylase-like protein